MSFTELTQSIWFFFSKTYKKGDKISPMKTEKRKCLSHRQGVLSSKKLPTKFGEMKKRWFPFQVLCLSQILSKLKYLRFQTGQFGGLELACSISDLMKCVYANNINSGGVSRMFSSVEISRVLAGSLSAWKRVQQRKTKKEEEKKNQQ